MNDAPSKGGKRAVLMLLRAVVSLSILGFVLSRISPGDLLARAKGAAYLELALVALLFVAMALLVALRWRLVARWLGLAVPAPLAVRAVFLGLFGGQVLPSSIGSDLLRGWVVARQTGRAGVVAASVVADRLAALCGASLLLAIGYAYVAHAALPMRALVVGAGALAGGCIAALIFRRLAGVDARGSGAAPLALGLAIAFVIQATATLAAVLSAAAYGIDSSLAVWLAIVPASIIAAALPVSINGWGVREGVMMALGVGHGLAPADALLVSLTLGLANVCASLPGAYLLVKAPREAAGG